MPALTARFLRPALALGAAALAGCVALAAEPQARPEPPRYFAELHAEPADMAALQARLQASAGVPVLRLQSVAPRRWAFTLQCDGPAACEAATRRLRDEAGLLKSLEPDPRVTLPPRPGRGTAR
jgi:hypothetical protein